MLGPRSLRVKFAVPRSIWPAVLTRKYPDCQVEITERSILKNRVMRTEARLHGPDPGRWVREIARMPGVERVEAWTREASSELVWVTHKISQLTDFCRECEVVPRCPFWVVQGATTWEVVGSSAALRRFARGLSHMVFSVRIEAVAPAHPSVEPLSLTGRQLQLFRRAIEEGYFEVPRRVSLTTLATRVSLSKSTLSRTLAVAEGKLLRKAERSGLLSELGTGPEEPTQGVHFVRGFKNGRGSPFTGVAQR